MFVCGINDLGQLGLSDEDDRNTLTAVPALPDGKVAKQVIAGYSHTMILAEDGTGFACGGNGHGQLGLGDTTDRNTFTAVPALPDGKVAKQVIAGSGHTMILAEDVTVSACGINSHGQLGLGDTTNRNSFTVVPFFGPDHPGLVPLPSHLGSCTFAVPAAILEGAAAITTSISPLQTDLMALVDDDDEILHFDMT